MVDYKKYINTLRKCAKEHENDRTFTGHIIVSNLCRDTANLLEEVEQESILNKIIAEIKSISPKTYPFLNSTDQYVKEDDVLQIINKYKAAES